MRTKEEGEEFIREYFFTKARGEKENINKNLNLVINAILDSNLDTEMKIITITEVTKNSITKEDCSILETPAYIRYTREVSAWCI